MEPTLVAVTLLSLGMAVAMSLVAWRLLREERRRSDARVARLAELAEERRVDLPLRRAAEPPQPPASVEPAAVAEGLFASATPSSGGGPRVVVFAVAAVLVVVIVTTLAWLGGGRRAEERSLSAGRVSPLELVSLRHAKADDTLTITGLVQNPADGRHLARVTAVAFVFDQAGEFVGSGRAPLEFALAPGAESPFQITIANAGHVGRYRIGFRTEDGAVLGHVDRRSAPEAGPAERASTAAHAGVTEPAAASR